MKEVSSFPPPVLPDLDVPLDVQRKASLKRFEIALEKIYAKYGQDFGDTEEVDLRTGEVFFQGKRQLGKSQLGKKYPNIIPFGSLTSYMDKTENNATSKRATYSIDELDEFILDSLAPALAPHATLTKSKPSEGPVSSNPSLFKFNSSHPIPFPLEAVPLDEFAASDTPSVSIQESSSSPFQKIKRYSWDDLDEFISNSTHSNGTSNKTTMKSASSPHLSSPPPSHTPTSSIPFPTEPPLKLSSSHTSTSKSSFHVKKKKPIFKNTHRSNVSLRRPPLKTVTTRTSPIPTRFRSLLTPSSSSSSIVSKSSIPPKPPDRPLDKKPTRIVIEISPIKSTTPLRKLSIHSTSPPSSPTPKRRKISFSSPFPSLSLSHFNSSTPLKKPFFSSSTPSSFPLHCSMYPNAQPMVSKYIDPPSSPGDELGVTSSSPVFLSRRKSAYPELIDFSLDHIKDELAI